MKLVKLKCPKCGKDMFVDSVDLEELRNSPKKDRLLPVCIFGCVVKKPEDHIIELGEKEFADQSELDGVVVQRLHDQAEELLHSIENLGVGGVDEPAAE